MQIKWNMMVPGSYTGISEGTGEHYYITRVGELGKGIATWEMTTRSGKNLGQRESLYACKRDIEEWDTEPPC